MNHSIQHLDESLDTQRHLGLQACVLVVATILFLTTALPAQGQYRLCVPSRTWFGKPAPQIDGIVNSSEWQGGFHVELGPNAAPDVILRGTRDANNLYLAVQANNLDNLFSGNSGNNPYASSLVVLTFDSGGGQFQQIHIEPVIDRAQTPYNGNSSTIEFWTGVLTGGAITWTIFPGTALHHPPWLNSTVIQASYSRDAAGSLPYHWNLEMALPFQTPTNSGLAVPGSGFFQLYVDVFRVVGANFEQTSWPPNNLEPGCPQNTPVSGCVPSAQIPNPASWGASTIDATKTCSLVNLDAISVTNATNVVGTLIDVSSPNTFNARVTNSAPPPGTGLPDLAKQVSAQFSIWNLGIPSLPQWQTIVTTNNPTATADLPAGTSTLSPDAWTVPPADQPKYDPNLVNDPTNPSHPHQCIRVLLSSSDLNTSFTNNPAFQNMDFYPASRFEQSAEISARGYPRRPTRLNQALDDEQLFNVYVKRYEQTLKPGEVGIVGSAQVPPARGREKGSGGVTSQLTLIVAACRLTGYYMTVDNRTLELCDPVGDFGYVVRHEGKARVVDWHVKFSGRGLEEVTDDRYRLRAPYDGVAKVTTNAEPEEQKNLASGKFAVFGDIGLNIPHGTFGSTFNTGISLNAGLEYIATAHLSAEGIYGYHHFPASGRGSLDLHQFSVNGAVYLTSDGPIRPFLNAGIGGYKADPGSTYFGGNFGGGILYDLTSHWGLRADYNLHALNTPGSVTKFSTIQFGLRFAF